MIITDDQAWKYYKNVHNWLTNYTPGEVFNKETIKYYHVNLWQPIHNLLEEVINKENRTEEEEYFVKECSYYGNAFRLHSCNSKQRKFIYETKSLQSWSKSLEGISQVSVGDDLILIISHTDRNYGSPTICVFGFLIYLFTYKKTFLDECIGRHYPLYNPKPLKRYEDEDEIIMPLTKDNINHIIKTNASNVFLWEQEGKLIPKKDWIRNSV